MPPNRRTLDDVLRTTEDVLREAGVTHVFVGGVAVLAFGMPRTTMAVDVIVALKPQMIPRIVAGFRAEGFLVSAEDLHDALTEAGHVTIQDRRSVYRIDLVPASTPGHREALRAPRRVSWRGRRLPFAAPAHAIVMKLRWGSDQDLEDALGIYLRQKRHLDLPALRSLARRNGVAGRLRHLEQRAEESARR
jgi:hypothetical protein